MNLEIEATFVEVNKAQLRKQLKSLGARLIQPEVLMRRIVFDTGEHSFTRVRDEGRRIVLTYKCQHDHIITGTEEINVEVSSYDDTIAILQASGLKPKADEDSYRESWELDGVEIDIDTWPWIPTYVEIEGQTPEAVETAAHKLDFDMRTAIYGSVDDVYKLYYDVDSHYINYVLPKFKFAKAPDFLIQNLRKQPLAPAKTQADPYCIS